MSQIAERAGDLEAAYKHLLKIAKPSANNFQVQVSLARVAFKITQYEVAHQALARLQKCPAPPNQVQLLVNATARALELHHPEAAEHFAQLANKIDPQTGAGLLSRIYERTHQMDKLKEVLSSQRQSQEGQRTDERFQLTQIKLLYREGRLDEAIAAANQCNLDKTWATHWNADLAHQIAHIFDAKGDYEQAFTSLTQAKALIQEMPKAQYFKKKSLRAQKDNELLRNAIDESHYKESSAFDGKSSMSQVGIVTGHPRSGTTLMERLIDRHPDMKTVEESTAMNKTYAAFITPLSQELQRRGEEFTAEEMAHHLSHADWATRKTLYKRYYQALSSFNPKRSKPRMLVDRNPMLITMLPVIHALMPEAPVVIILRDPRDVCLSFYMQWLGLNPVSINLDSLENTAKTYMNIMSVWLKIRKYQAPKFLEIKYENLVQDAETAYGHVLKHLGQEPFPLDMTPAAQNEGSLVMTPSYEAVTRPVYQSAVSRWKNYEKHFEKAREILAPAVEAFGYEA